MLELGRVPVSEKPKFMLPKKIEWDTYRPHRNEDKRQSGIVFVITIEEPGEPDE